MQTLTNSREPECRLQDTTKISLRHQRDSTKAPPRHHRDTTEIPPRHHRSSCARSLCKDICRKSFVRVSLVKFFVARLCQWSLRTIPAQGLYERSLGKIALGNLHTSSLFDKRPLNKISVKFLYKRSLSRISARGHLYTGSVYKI